METALGKMDCLVSRPQRRRRQREMLRQEEEDEHYEDDYIGEDDEEGKVANDFASLEAMLASQSSDGNARHPAAQKEAEHHQQQPEENASVPPSSPSTLSDDSISSQKNRAQTRERGLSDTQNQRSQQKHAFPSTFARRAENKISNKQPGKKRPIVMHTAKSIVGSR